MKKVIKDSVETVDLSKVQPGSIYIIVRKDVVYKAHKTEDIWRFVSMADSISVWISNDTLSELIESEMSIGVFEFESFHELCKWMVS